MRAQWQLRQDVFADAFSLQIDLDQGSDEVVKLAHGCVNAALLSTKRHVVFGALVMQILLSFDKPIRLSLLDRVLVSACVADSGGLHCHLLEQLCVLNMLIVHLFDVLLKVLDCGAKSFL